MNTYQVRNSNMANVVEVIKADFYKKVGDYFTFYTGTLAAKNEPYGNGIQQVAVVYKPASLIKVK